MTNGTPVLLALRLRVEHRECIDKVEAVRAR